MSIGRWIRVIAASTMTALGLAACGGGGGGIGGTGVAMGTMRVSMTDAPACGFDNVWVTVKSVRVHQSSTAADGDSGWSEVLVDAPNGRRIDLLELRNGVQTELGLTALPAGTYTQMRLILADNTGSSPPFANAVFPTGDQERALDTPSGQQTGLKLNVDVTVPEGKEANVLLDFDACQSVKGTGNNKYILTPVIGVTTEIRDAGLRVQGYVAAPLIDAATRVSVVQTDGSQLVPAVAPDPYTGRFIVYPLPAGTDYMLVLTAPAYTSAVVTGVPVQSGTPTDVSGPNRVALSPAPVVTGVRGVSGTVSPASAAVRALQVLSNGSTIDVQHASVDSANGSFALTLPIDPPGTVAYSANPTSITFAPDSPRTGLYTIRASLLGANLDRQVDVKGTVNPLSFAF